MIKDNFRGTRLPYLLEPMPFIQRNLLHMKALSEEELYVESLLTEPKTSLPEAQTSTSSCEHMSLWHGVDKEKKKRGDWERDQTLSRPIEAVYFPFPEEGQFLSIFTHHISRDRDRDRFGTTRKKNKEYGTITSTPQPTSLRGVKGGGSSDKYPSIRKKKVRVLQSIEESSFFQDGKK